MKTKTGAFKRVQRGFTLIELMIVTAIVGILAAVAVPQYQNYVLRSRWASNVGELNGLKTAIFNCMNENQTDGTLCNELAELQAFGYPGTALTTPSFATGAVTLAGTAPTAGENPTPGSVTIAFTGNAAAGGFVYNASCANNAGGNMVCLSTATDTIPARAGFAAGTGQRR